MTRPKTIANVSKAAAGDTRDLDAALTLLADIDAGLAAMRPQQPGRNMDQAEK